MLNNNINNYPFGLILSRTKHGLEIHWWVYHEFFACTPKFADLFFGQKIVYHYVAISVELLKKKNLDNELFV